MLTLIWNTNGKINIFHNNLYKINTYINEEYNKFC